VSWGGWGESEGSIIISPKGEIVAEEMRPGRIAIADIDPFAGRQNADWSNRQDDMRARLFRERRPAAYKVLTDPEPPGVRILPEMIPGPPLEIARMVNRATTVGHVEYEAAEEHLKAGRTAEAAAAFEALIRDYPATWFESAARRGLEAIRSGAGGGVTLGIES
jgi:TolA-binding protein